MRKPEISKETICQLGREKGLKEICEFDIKCQDSDNQARKDYTISITGFDCAQKKKTLFFTLTEWEEIHNGDN